MASQMVVPASTDTLFFRNFINNQNQDDIRDFFEREADSPVSIEFFKQSEIDGRLFIALKFETKDIAKDILNRYDGQDVLGDRVQVSWFKDLRKVKRNFYYNKGGRGWNHSRGGNPYYREREWGEEYYHHHPRRGRGRGGGGGGGRDGRDHYDRDDYYSRQRRDSSGERHVRSSKYDRSSSRSESRSRSRSRSSTPRSPVKRRHRSKADKYDTVKSTVREVRGKSDDRSASRGRSDDESRRSDRSDYDDNYSDYSRDGKRGRSRERSASREKSPPSSPPTKSYRDPRSEKYKQKPAAYAQDDEEAESDRDDGESYEEKRHVTIPSGGQQAEAEKRRSYSKERGKSRTPSYNRSSALNNSATTAARKRSFDEDADISATPTNNVGEEEGKKRKYNEWTRVETKTSNALEERSVTAANVNAVQISRDINGSLNREVEKGLAGLPADKMQILREKKVSIEKAYCNDCETFATVVKMLISKDPLLEDKLQMSLRENLKEIGQRCIYELREYIDRMRLSDGESAI